VDDDRLARLETQAAYLEKMLDDLNGVVFDLQKRFDHLEKRVDRLARAQTEGPSGRASTEEDSP
jgi:uncharacterized coiled-coil protein SlyX